LDRGRGKEGPGDPRGNEQPHSRLALALGGRIPGPTPRGADAEQASRREKAGRSRIQLVSTLDDSAATIGDKPVWAESVWPSRVPWFNFANLPFPTGIPAAALLPCRKFSLS